MRSEISELINTLGRPVIMSRLGLSAPSALYNAEARGVLPADWYLGFKDLADARGVQCPTRLFRFRGQ